MNNELNDLLQALPGSASLEAREGGLWMNAPGLDVQAMARLMLDRGARLSTITALALDGVETEIIYHYTLQGTAYNLRVQTRDNALDSITPITAAASWPEREIADLYAVTFAGHPNPARLVRPAQMQPGYFREPGGAAGKALRNNGRR